MRLIILYIMCDNFISVKLSAYNLFSYLFT